VSPNVNANEQAIDAAINAHAAGHLDAAGRALLRSHFGHDPDEACPAAKEHGLGWPTDEPPRGGPTYADALAAAGVELAGTFPSIVTTAGLPGVYDQGTTPRCVSYAWAAIKNWQDHHDTGYFSPDFGRFASEIGTTTAGAYVGNAISRLKSYGYPTVNNATPESLHRIAANSLVDHTVSAIKQAITTSGVLSVVGTWYHSWFHPYASGVLPAPDYSVGGHDRDIYGWNDSLLAWRIRNSWGAAWGVSGDCYQRYSQLGYLGEIDASIDVADAVRRTMAYGAQARPDVWFGTALGTVAAGAVITTIGAVTGAKWTSPTGATGTKWYRVIAINGIAVGSRFPGHSVVYIYAGAVKGG